MNDQSPDDNSQSDCSAAPSFTELSRQQCEELLRRHRVGRLAYTLHDRVQLVPIHFVYDEGWIYGRTGTGGKLNTLERNKSVAFEIDQSDSLFSWKSVVVHGAFYFIGQGGDADEQLFKHAVGLMRKLIPGTLDEIDPVPFRNQLFRIHAAEISGRAAVSSGGEVREPSGLPRSASAGQPEADTRLLYNVSAAVGMVLGESASRVNIVASDGVVILGGSLDDFTKRRAVEDAVRNVNGVQAIVQQIETDWQRGTKQTPAELGLGAVRAIEKTALSGAHTLKVVIENGWLRLDGATASDADRRAVLSALHEVQGIHGVIDRTDRG